MVTHTGLYVLQGNLLVRNNPEWHRFCFLHLAHRIRQVTVHILGEVVEEAPHTCFTIATSTEIGIGIGGIEGKILVLSGEEAHFTGKLDYVLRIKDVLLVFLVESGDTALVGVCTDGIIGNADSHPYGTCTARSLAYHFHNPGLIGVADGESLTLRVVTILGYERSHHIDGFTGRLGTLQTQIHQRTIVNHSGGIHQFLATSESGLADAHLIFIDVANHVVGGRSFGYLAMTNVCVVVDNLAHLPFGMGSGRIMTKACKHTIGISIVSTHHRPVC